MKKRYIGFLFFVASFNTAADTRSLPKLELGAALTTLEIPNYRGAQNTTRYFLPLPYIKYRGDRFKIDEGLQNFLLNSENLKLSISVSGALPVNDDNPERIGMAELDATLSLGPSLDYRLVQQGSGDWWLKFPLRMAFTLNRDFSHIGQIFQPRLVWKKPMNYFGDWKIRAAIGPVYASREFHNYYYGVNAADALPTRPVYDADGGYSGWRGTLSYSKRYAQFWLGGFVRYDSLRHSVVEASPLVSKPDAWFAGIAVGWVFLDLF